jgi:CheY-like chemotaxis protein
VETPATLANTSRPARPLHGTETILFVDDEPGILMTARLALEAEGYTVLVANDGADALRIVESHTGPIHLVITDVVMPGMGGRPLADALRARFPGIRVLFVSGYTDDAVIRHGVIEKTEYFLQKPFAPLGLVKKVRDVLDGTA